MALTNPLWLGPVQGEDYGPPASARVHRGILDLLFTEGVVDVGSGELRVTAGTGMTVNVATGRGVVDGDDVAFQGAFLCQNEGSYPMQVPAAPASNSRVDLLVLRIYDGQSTGGTRNENVFEIVSGSPSASPVAPTVPNSAVELARWVVPAGLTSMANTTITDRRVQSGAASLRVGTQIMPATQTERDAIAAPFDGQSVYNLSQSSLEAADATTATWASTRGLGLVFGDGSDGDVTITGNVTLLRNMNYRNLTVAAGAVLSTNGFRVLVSGALRNAGLIHADGGAGTDANYSATFPQSGVTYGIAGQFSGGSAGGNPDNSGLSRRLGLGAIGGVGSIEWYDPGIGTQGYPAGNGSDSGNTGANAASYGGAGGTGGMVSGSQTYNRGAGGAAPAVTYIPLFDLASLLGIYGLVHNGSTFLRVVGGAGGGGGGNTQGGGSNYTSRAASGGGGGGVVVIVAEVLINTGTIAARGGRGGNASGPYAGPGGGGGGGVVVLFTRRIRDAGTVSVAGGAAGSGGTSVAAVAGGSGTLFKIGV